MAGSITISSITLDSDNNFSIKSNTGSTILSANGTGLITGIANGSTIISAQLTTPTITGDATINGMTVGKGGGAVATNTAVGNGALNANTTGANNTAVGYLAGYTNSTGVNNVAVGGEALRLNTTDYCTAVGYRALLNNSTGARNSAFGHYAGNGNTTGGYNTLLGLMLVNQPQRVHITQYWAIKHLIPTPQPLKTQQ